MLEGEGEALADAAALGRFLEPLGRPILEGRREGAGLTREGRALERKEGRAGKRMGRMQRGIRRERQAYKGGYLVRGKEILS